MSQPQSSPSPRPDAGPVTDSYRELVHLLLDYGDWVDPNPSRSKVDALTHATQAATRAERANYDDQFTLACLVHDAARPLSDVHHGEVIAEIMRSKVDRKIYWALRAHGMFQADLIHGQKQAWMLYGDMDWYQTAYGLAGIDAVSFDPDYDNFEIDHFLPRLEALFAS
jgi:predicted HD phosphohydrolase